jgi:ribosomal protein S18 acetylase RimI-like enzyme
VDTKKVPGYTERIKPERATALLEFLCKLDTECQYMLYQPGERKANGHDLRGHIKSLRQNSAIFVRVVPEYDIVGYLALYGGRLERCAHVASLSCGVLTSFRCQGVATALWTDALEFATVAGLERIELTVVQNNLEAVNLYHKWGFEADGMRRGSFGPDRLNEVYMSFSRV